MEDSVDLGFAEVCDSEWLTNVYFPSKLGGKPAWLHLGDLPTKEYLQCTKCNKQKSFLCQIYAPYDDDINFHRTIYVFICRTESCYITNDNSNITILRSQLPLQNSFYSNVPPPEDDSVPEILPNNAMLCAACGCLGPFRCARCKKTYYCGSEHQRLHWKYHKLSCSADELASLKVDDPPIAQILFPEWEIDMNTTDGDSVNRCSKDEIDENKELLEFAKLTVSGTAGTFQNLPESELEKYVQGCEKADDKHFRKFLKVCETDPLQIIRYKRNGRELWISDPEKTVKERLENIPKCDLCGQERVFEFQIMPQILNYLKDTNVDWGIIAVYTCPKSCPLPQGKGYVEEYCIKQDILNVS